MLGQRFYFLFWAFVALALTGLSDFARAETVFYESEVVVRNTGTPEVVTDSFTMDDVEGDFTLVVHNGDLATGDDRVSSAVVTLNGVEIVGTNEFNQQVSVIEKPVTLLPTNELAIEVRGKPGTYITVFVVGDLWNRRPVAAVGPDSNALASTPVPLDGSRSFDPDGDVITFHWALVDWPDGSAAALTDDSRPDPQFTPDLAGDYLFELTVNDGQIDSDPDPVKVSAFDGVTPPNARAGRDQHALLDSTVSLEGSESNDPNDFPITFAWSVVELPTNSTVTLSSSDTAHPEFVPDVAGTYLFNLRVDNSAGLFDEDSVQVFASEPNVQPTADAGPKKAARTGEVVALDGSGSFDPDNSPQVLNYSWSLVTHPAGSALTSEDIGNVTTATPTLTPDVEGPYIARLRVDDGEASDEDNVLAYGDNGLPEISIDSPTDGSVVTTPRPDFEVSFSDNEGESGIDPESFSADLDGSDITESFAVTASGATYAPEEDLPAGEKTLSASIADLAGNGATAVSTFQIAFLRAIPGANVNTGNAPLTVFFTTDGEDPAGTIEVFRWDFEGDGVWDTYDTVARDYTHTYYQSGTYEATLYVQSSTGESASASITITIDNSMPTATADLIPSNGAVPLTVSLIGSGSDPDGSIVLYEWDYEGDGVFDYSSPSTGNTSYTYTQEGSFQAVFRVTDNDGLTATALAGVTVVRVGPPGSPTASASASPTSGDAPLTVNFTGTATDPDNAIVLYEWDFDGDGVYDYSSPTIGNTSHTYTTAGYHVASLRVTDETGLTGIDQVLITVTIAPSLSIETKTVGFPQSGTGGLTASASSQYSSYYSPDMAVDGNAGTYWFTAYGQTPAAGYDTWFEVRFDTLQNVRGLTIQWYSSAYRLTSARIELYGDDDTLLHSQEETFPGSPSQVTLPNVDQVRRVRIVGLESANSSYVAITELTIDSTPVAGQEDEPVGTNIITSVGAETNVTILIKDEDGNTVRTLVDNEPRGSGFFTDYWDTRDDQGVIVHDGVYYAVLYYLLEGQLIAYDLTDTTGGTRYSFPFGSGCNTRASFDSSVRPFEDYPLELNFTLCEPQEVTAFIGPLYSGLDQTRVRTIVNRQPYGAGTHTIYWDGLDDNGNIAEAPPGDSLITGFWRYDLPDNAMVMTGGRPLITAISADPNYFSPFSEKCDEQGRSEGITLDFAASEVVQTVELRVYSVTTGALLKRETHTVNSDQGLLFWGGKNNQGEYVDIGDYQVGIIATDSDGNNSMLRYTLVRVDY